VTQFDWGSIDATTTSGTTLATWLDSFRDALNTSHKGPTAPAYKQVGTYWVDDSAAPWQVKFWDGTQWVDLWTIDPTAHTAGGLGGTTFKLSTEDEGTEITDDTLIYDFQGDGVTATYMGSGEVRVTISGVATTSGVSSFNARSGDVLPVEGDYTLDKLGDVAISGPVTGETVQYNGSVFANTDGRFVFSQVVLSPAFDGVTQSFSMTSLETGGSLTVAHPAQIILELGGVVQEPITHYDVSGSTLIFAEAPVATDAFAGVAFTGNVGTPAALADFFLLENDDNLMLVTPLTDPDSDDPTGEQDLGNLLLEVGT
jgi:hypothetical protein